MLLEPLPVGDRQPPPAQAGDHRAVLHCSSEDLLSCSDSDPDAGAYGDVIGMCLTVGHSAIALLG